MPFFVRVNRNWKKSFKEIKFKLVFIKLVFINIRALKRICLKHTINVSIDYIINIFMKNKMLWLLKILSWLFLRHIVLWCYLIGWRRGSVTQWQRRQVERAASSCSHHFRPSQTNSFTKRVFKSYGTFRSTLKMRTLDVSLLNLLGFICHFSIYCHYNFIFILSSIADESSYWFF